ncbi:integrase [Flavobacterium sp. CG_9.10]|uniref:phage integrase SAM-like domain-containing protein n=1 Tax=Flavobacterium sp. CG_9.10 TaxID=2787729 RepID=UPI0018CA9834|nr:phage integrase SAM-like domain-containing protein [Flavobacterium sp. CG_9.10]MBG6109354.1 integrase [Flavobacterium sp. CG_9.10]
MAKIKFLVQGKSDNSQIYIRVSISQFLSIKKKTGFTINPKDWSAKVKDKGTDRPKQNNPENKITHSSLNKLETWVFDNLNNDLSKGILIDVYWLETQINNCFKRVTKTDNSLLVNHIEYIIDNANTRKIRINGGFKIGLSKSTIKNYTLFKNIITEYQKITKKQIHFIGVTEPFVEKFTNWLINSKNYSTNYAGKQLEILKTVCIDAEKNEIIITPYSKTIQHFRESDKDRYIQTLSFYELEQIQNSDFTNQEVLDKFKKENPHLTNRLAITTETMNNARNWILLGCEIGQRGGDLLSIENENIRYNGKSIYIDIIQKKTNKSVTVGVFSAYVTELVLNNFPRKIPHQKLNDIIKVVCKLAGISAVVEGKKLNTETNRKELGFHPKYDLITSHCFRRSFATNYYKKIPTPILINITGHSKESLFLTYINKREDKDANADLFKKFYEELQQNKEPQMRIVKNGN